MCGMTVAMLKPYSLLYSIVEILCSYDSENIDNITKYAKAIDTAILVKNGPSYSALGFGGEGFCTFTIASRTGEGLTSASTFTKRRRCVMTDSLCIR